MQRIIEERYATDAWNIYAAQASDGDNYPATARPARASCVTSCCRYAGTPIEVVDEREAGMFRSEGNASLLWRDYKTVADVTLNFVMKRVFSKSDIFPVFHQLFAKNQKVA
jgi:uncharacterized sporulation protein YeaH/YhbH (DUF444 family)